MELQSGFCEALEDARAILDNCSLAVHFVDAAGTIIYANQAELDCLGYTREEYLGRNIMEFHVLQDTIGDIFDRLNRGQTLLNYEAELRCKDGSTKTVQINSNVYWGRQGEFVHTRCFTRDITELKRAQLRLLEEQKMRLAEAEEFRRKQSDFIDMLCHELRNPLNGVLGLLVCMREEIDGLKQALKNHDYKTAAEKAEATTQMLDHVDECAQHQRVIMDDVLNLSRLETKETNDPSAEETTFDPRNTIDSVLKMFAGTIHLKRLQISVDTSDLSSGTRVMADENRFKQILINIISNAIKFSNERGSLTLSMKTLNDREGGHTYLETSVRDTGIGISEHEQALLFTPFSAQKRKRVQEYGGSGLGLRITRQIIDLMHGALSVKSKLGEGTTVTFRVRCEQVPTKECEQQRSVSHSPSASVPLVGSSSLDSKHAHGSNSTTMNVSEQQGLSGEVIEVEKLLAQQRDTPLRVLVCEDNLINQKVISRFLKIRQMDHLVAGSAEEAIRIYGESLSNGAPLDMIFMDIELPGMNGIEATMQIRKMESKRGSDYRVPIICMSGYTRNEYKLMAFRVGMNDYISKPFSRDKVFQLIDTYAASRPL